MSESPASNIRIICLGNALHTDDGLGYQLLKLLHTQPFPDGIDTFDGGVGGLTLLPAFQDCQRVVLVDIVKSQEPPGSIFFFEDITSTQLSTFTEVAKPDHGGNISTVLAMLPVYLDNPPKVDLFAVSGGAFDYYSSNLSASVVSALPTLQERLLQYVCMKTNEMKCQ